MPSLPEVVPPKISVFSKIPWLKVVLFALLGIVLIVWSFILGYLFSSKKCPKATCVTPPPVSENLTTFTSQQMKMTFQYPSEWGVVEEKAEMIGTPEQYHGHSYNLTFSNNPYLTFVGASKDSTSPGVGGACPIRFLFKGTSDTGLLSCGQCNQESEGCVACSEAAIAGQPAVSYFYIPTAYCALIGFQKVIYIRTPFNSANGDFPGLVLALNIATNINGQLSNSGDQSTTGCPTDSEETKQSRQATLANFNSMCQEYKTKFISGSTLDYLSTLQLSQLQNLLNSLHFN